GRGARGRARSRGGSCARRDRSRRPRARGPQLRRQAQRAHACSRARLAPRGSPAFAPRALVVQAARLGMTRMDVLYRDERLWVVSKPSGLITHRGWANDRETALSLARGIAGKHVHAVQRLDRATSGVLLFALDPETAGRLSKELELGGFEKRYVALVRGV